MKSLLAAMFALAIGCSSKATKPPPEDAPAGDGGLDPVEIAGRLDRQCVGGNLEACRNLGVMYAEGTGISPDPRRATALFDKACAGGNMPACNYFALALAEGIGVERQPVKAVEVYQKACDRGYKLACRNLGLMLRDGRGVAVDLVRAEPLLDKACKGGVPFACTNAGDLDAARAVKGGAARYKEMVAHYKQGCDSGDPTACRQIGIAYLEGKGLPKSTSAAAVWLERACMPDDPVACRLLGVMKLQGIGLARDVEHGRQMLARACDAKDDEACRVLKTLADSPGDADDAGVTRGGGREADASPPATIPYQH
ncbi:MAG TPA: tetratricopeptide repeat protein [Kofleriaceae bacterium]|nr:tetratricopeptide repeat protein [Kofleriaceae bacterium]